MGAVIMGEGADLDLIARAAAGELPDWAVAGPERRAHSRRVAALLGEWAADLGLGESQRRRWLAAGWLHDALRDADPESLRPLVPHDYRDLPGPLLHGPAAAARLRGAGVDDTELLDAITYHTIGHGSLETLGRALYLADTLEPGRTFAPVWTASLRARLPHSFDAVLVEVAANRLEHLIALGYPLRPETVSFWNILARSP
jgi:2-amino-4-hydroxy-6-hydroxymethyldihydropteridine diphosphokinase